MYINVSPSNTFRFLAYIALLFGAVLATLYVKHTYYPGYMSVDFGLQKVKQEVNVLKYKLAFDAQGKSLPSSLLALAVAPFSSGSSAPASATTTPARDIPVLLYHGIVKNPDRFSTTPQIFADQMFALKHAGYRTITLAEMRDFLQGKISLPAKSFLLTFDDGRRDSYEGADPVLQATGFHAVMFVATGDSLPENVPDTSYYLNTAALAAMAESGRWELGSHAIQETGGYVPVGQSGTEGNFLSDKMWLYGQNRLETDQEYLTRITRELSRSKADLEKLFGTQVIGFAYPFGDYGQQTSDNPKAPDMIRAVIRQNYDLAFRQVWPSDNEPTSNVPGADMLTLKRVESGTTWTGDYLVRLLQNAQVKPLPLTDDFSSDRGWHGTWGDVTAGGNALRLSAYASTTGASAFLDGTQSWGDYLYVIRADWTAGKNLSLFARMRDGTDYLSCTFGRDVVSIEERNNDVLRILARSKEVSELPQEGAALAMKVTGSTVSCFEGSRQVVSSVITTSSPALDSGSIGLRIWDPAPGNASVTLKMLQAFPAASADAALSTLPAYPFTPAPTVKKK
jgi:peptidoglycan/xylan/chitin deacetylase (PgdA/CDA1 family)